MRQWVFDYSTLIATLLEAIKQARDREDKITRRLEMRETFQKLRDELTNAPVLGTPEYTKEFYLFCHCNGQVMTAVLTQKYPLGHKPIAYFSGLLDSVMKGRHPCEQALATEAYAVQKSTPMVMGAPLTLYAEHAVFAIIQKPKTTLTTQRVSGSEVILSLPSLKVVKCNMVNPATFFVHPILNPKEFEHNCATQSPNVWSPATEDPIPDSVVYFVEGSSTIDQETGIRHTGAAVVRAQRHSCLATLQTIEQLTLPAHYSAQAAELKELIGALKSGAGELITVYSNSAYITPTVNTSIMRWSR
ncbi:hypothetical protein NDU88_008232 [Pleurodeles waltl]|uniref:RNase H type-1 domain-containing protein n=1 Tax=Pleurodeles waltl TaxID=8319 RepID=A0AAV7NZN9_PLEWA|nr:hypothetical protein NDU88_008232 [Pleurodeles waltl]